MEISKKQTQTSARPELKFTLLDEEEMSKLTGGGLLGGLTGGSGGLSSGLPIVGGLTGGSGE